VAARRVGRQLALAHVDLGSMDLDHLMLRAQRCLISSVKLWMAPWTLSASRLSSCLSEMAASHRCLSCGTGAGAGGCRRWHLRPELPPLAGGGALQLPQHWHRGRPGAVQCSAVQSPRTWPRVVGPPDGRLLLPVLGAVARDAAGQGGPAPGRETGRRGEGAADGGPGRRPVPLLLHHPPVRADREVELHLGPGQEGGVRGAAPGQVVRGVEGTDLQPAAGVVPPALYQVDLSGRGVTMVPMLALTWIFSTVIWCAGL
jgi:hypothetical protein